MGKQVTSLIRELFSVRFWGYFLFWSWNIIFLAFMFLGFAPYMLPQVIQAVRIGLIPAAFLLYAVILTIIPAAAAILGATVLRRSPGLLLTLGYGVEGPLMLALTIRFFAIREATAAVTLLLIVAGLGWLTLLWQILDRRIDERGAWPLHLRLIGLTLLLAIGVYVGVWVGFYAVPLGAEGLKAIGNILVHLPDFFRSLWYAIWNLRLTPLGMIPFSVLGFILMIYTATLLVGLPLAMPFLSIRAWWRGARGLTGRFGVLRAAALTSVVLVVCVASFVWLNQQPQHQAFALLKNPPATLVEAQALLDKQETIRAGLLNAYLAQFRYVSSVGEVRHVSDMYKWSLGLPPEQAKQVEQAYEIVARPLLYEPVKTYEPDPHQSWINRALTEEPAEAARLYKAVFDQHINDGERDTIVRAVRSTWSLDQAESAWQAVDDREIHLVRQEVNVTEHGDWAEVELYEVYQNQTSLRQEVVYYFSLPESAVITGVWLGNTANRAERFVYRVAPRGAAQAVYRNEVRRQMDPALVEQIGPRQYRLRVFPVEPERQRWERNALQPTVEDGPPLHMWLMFRVMARDNAWPLPRLAERRNVYWDSATTRLINNKPMQAKGDAWLPASVPATTPVKPIAHRVDFPNSETVLARPATPGDLPKLPNGLRLAIVLDRSHSMAAHAAGVKTALAQLVKAADAKTSDVYLTASQYYGEAPSRIRLDQLKVESIMYAGGQNAAELLGQFNSLSSGQSYDVILVLTDGTGYELAESGVKVSTPNAPVWMVHLDGEFPLGYDDGTLEAIQASGGGVAASVEEALGRWAVAREAAQSASREAISDIVDGYVWTTLPSKDVSATSSPSVTDDFASFGARRIILAAMQRQRGSLGQLSTLDQLHAIAVQHSVVTPYSSMIVLVNDVQQKLLDELQARGDRFEREVEQVGETVPQNPFNVAGVPEPEEWLLLALAALMLIGFVRARWRSAVRPHRA